MKPLIPTDPLFTQQWFLYNIGQTILGRPQPAGGPLNDINVIPVWPDYTGAGVRVAAVDDGFEGTHPDLAANYRADLSYDVGQNKPGAAPGTDDNHGTAVMGLMVAARNGIGGVGVAYGATAVGYRTEVTETHPLLNQFDEATAKMLADGVSAVNNSYGSVRADKPLRTASDQPGWEADFKRLATEGRGGLGIVTVFAGGNDRGVNAAGAAAFLTSYDPTNTSPYAINVAAANQDGTVTSYSTPGPNLLVAAPGSGASGQIPRSIVTTDRQGSSGYNDRKNGDYTDSSISAFNGTSAAAPIATGVVALMLQANPNLGYRDVQEILAYSAHMPPSAATQKSFAKDWNGGAHPYSPDAGFGNIDALAAVRLAETWNKQGTAANIARIILPGEGETVAAGSTQAFSTTIPLDPPSSVRVQHVTVTVDLDAPDLSLVTLALVNRNQVGSLLLDRPNLAAPKTHLLYTFDTVAEWGRVEDALSTYSLTVRNLAGSGPVTINSFSVQLLGDADIPDHTYVYNNDYAALAAADPLRETLRDRTAGNHTVNAAAVSGDSVIDLRPGGTGSLGGAYFETMDGITVRTAYTGDGNDRLFGNGMDNVLGAGRGINTVDGGAGQDTAVLIGSRAGYQLGLGAAGITVTSNDAATQDTLASVEALRFGDANVDLTGALAGRITAGKGASEFGHAYAGPAAGLDWEFAAITPQSLVIGASTPNAYLRSGSGNDALQALAGSNVLDGGAGSNWLVGATGADGGRDTFFVSGLLDPKAATSWDTVLNFHAGDMLTVWGYDDARDSYAWQDGLGAAGYTGATLTVTGAGRAAASLVTLAGLSTADDHVVATAGSVGGLSYLALVKMA